mmetsp:Transcript_26876/g.70599  ORF Transcript_26876/g.70599 Transcript_26876/m.70599 type:complete len:216 (-) Transcript_26876:369-1016(-)
MPTLAKMRSPTLKRSWGGVAAAPAPPGAAAPAAAASGGSGAALPGAVERSASSLSWRTSSKVAPRLSASFCICSRINATPSLTLDIIVFTTSADSSSSSAAPTEANCCWSWANIIFFIAGFLLMTLRMLASVLASMSSSSSGRLVSMVSCFAMFSRMGGGSAANSCRYRARLSSSIFCLACSSWNFSGPISASSHALDSASQNLTNSSQSTVSSA